LDEPIPHDYFIDRYLRKLTIAKDEGMEAAFFDILKEQRSRKAIARPLASNRPERENAENRRFGGF
jgi:hypothetical protein